MTIHTAAVFTTLNDRPSVIVNRAEFKGRDYTPHLFQLVDNSIQELVETLEAIFPDWYDATQNGKKGEK
jgi:hypothetical protein